jgi:CDP-glucose 4,6-dehydratase
VGLGQGALEDLDVSFWSGKRILLTGHTGFKGAWAARWLSTMGAKVSGLALPPQTGINLYDMLGQEHLANSHLVDLRDLALVDNVVKSTDPELVLHMAAQPLVRLSYEDPVGTFSSNVMGTVHLLDALRRLARPEVILVVTSDKVYANDGSGRAYAEADPLGGHDPYSASKAATEIAAASFRDAYFAAAGQTLVTARGGNVIGGGDYSADRLVPDIVRALSRNEAVALRNPEATRPWQHVLDCLDGYFTYLQALAMGRKLPTALNFGPPAGTPSLSVGAITDGLFAAMGRPAAHRLDGRAGPHEMAKLSINPGLAASLLPWRPRLSSDAMLRLTADWYAAQAAGQDMTAVTDAQIAHYQDLAP